MMETASKVGLIGAFVECFENLRFKNRFKVALVEGIEESLHVSKSCVERTHGGARETDHIFYRDVLVVPVVKKFFGSVEHLLLSGNTPFLLWRGWHNQSLRHVEPSHWSRNRPYSEALSTTLGWLSTLTTSWTLISAQCFQWILRYLMDLSLFAYLLRSSWSWCCCAVACTCLHLTAELTELVALTSRWRAETRLSLCLISGERYSSFWLDLSLSGISANQDSRHWLCWRLQWTQYWDLSLVEKWLWPPWGHLRVRNTTALLSWFWCCYSLHQSSARKVDAFFGRSTYLRAQSLF